MTSYSKIHTEDPHILGTFPIKFIRPEDMALGIFGTLNKNNQFLFRAVLWLTVIVCKECEMWRFLYLGLDCGLRKYDITWLDRIVKRFWWNVLSL
jgi:hypothetical protein